MDNYHMVVALAGNPNVGKSTIFNGITGLKQHTANWPGVTVETASAEYTLEGKTCIFPARIPLTHTLRRRRLPDNTCVPGRRTPWWWSAMPPA